MVRVQIVAFWVFAMCVLVGIYRLHEACLSEALVYMRVVQKVMPHIFSQ
jgi:hypothetical protein